MDNISFESGTHYKHQNEDYEIENKNRGVKDKSYSQVRSIVSYSDDDKEYWCRGPISARHCGTMLWNLHNCVSLEMTIDKSFRLINYANDTVCAVSGDGESCALIHKIGVAYAQKDCVEVRGCDVVNVVSKNDKYAKLMGNNTIAFSALKSGVVYVLDEVGVQTKGSETMTNLHHDMTFNVFLKGSRCGRQYKQDAIDIISESYYKLGKDMTQKWLTNGVKISYTKAGILNIWRDEGKIHVLSDLNGTAKITTPQVSVVARGGKEPQFEVCKDNLKVTYDGLRFVTRNCKQAAGLDRDGLFKFFD